MGQVKTWQKVTIGILVAALIAVVASIITRNADANAANSQPSYAAEAETQTSDYYGELADETYVPETTKEQKAPALSEKKIADELFKDFEKHYGKVHQKGSANEYYNTHYDVYGTGVHIIPFHIWYADGKMYADSYVVNMQPNYVKNISVNDYQIGNGTNLVAEDSFGPLNGNIELAPGQHVTHLFVFPQGSFAKSDFSDGIQFFAESTWVDF